MRSKLLLVMAMMMAGMLWPVLSSAEDIEVKGLQYDVDNVEMVATVQGYVGRSTSVVIPKSIKHEGVEYYVTGIDTRAFRDSEMQKRIRKIVVGDAVRSIGDNTFEGCTELTSVTIGKSVTAIGYSAFSGCSNLAKIEIPELVDSIGGYAFSECISLAAIVIGGRVASIGNKAFAYCNKLKTITCRAAVVPKVEEETFRNLKVKDVNLVVPKSAVEDYRKAEGWKEMGMIVDY